MNVNAAPRSLFVPVMAALAGVASLLLLFPRFDPGATAHEVLTRDQAIAKTRQLAAANGLNTTGWKPIVVESLEHPAGPLKIQTALMPPHGGQHFEAAWFPDGRLDWSRLPGQPATYKMGAMHVKGSTETDQPGKVQVRWDQGAGKKLSYLALEILDTLWRIGVVAYLVVMIVRRRIRYRVGLILAAVLTVWAVVSFGEAPPRRRWTSCGRRSPP